MDHLISSENQIKLECFSHIQELKKIHSSRAKL